MLLQIKEASLIFLNRLEVIKMIFLPRPSLMHVCAAERTLVRFTTATRRYERTKKTAWLLMMPDPVEVSGTSDVQDIPGFGLRQPRAVKRASV